MTLNQIAGLYLAEDQMEQALHLYDKLLNYILNHNQALLCRNGLLPMVLHNYTRALNIAQRYADGVRYAEEGRRACVEYGHYQYLPGFNGLLPMVLHNYTRALNIAQRYADGVRYAEEGRRACVEYGHYQYLPGFVALRGEGLHFTGQDGKSAD